MKRATLLLLPLVAFLISCKTTTEKPADVKFESFIFRTGDNGDNWCVTWGQDDFLYTSQCDGRGWRDKNNNQRDFMNTRVWKISGGPDTTSFNPVWINKAPDYSRTAQQVIYGPIDSSDARTEFPPQHKLDVWNWYGYGIVSIDGNIYQFNSHCGERHGFGWFDGTQLIWRPKGKNNWLRWNGTDANNNDKWLLNKGDNKLLFFNEPDLAFSFITIAQFGKDYSENNDGYVYLYSPEGKEKSNRLNMARVKKDDILNRKKWEYFVETDENDNAKWTQNLNNRGLVHEFPSGWGFYSWLPSVVWNKKLGVFIMATAGTQAPGTGKVLENYMHYETGALMFLWAENPWGPWKEFYWNKKWFADDPENRLYLPQLSPKWISEDGKDMYMIFSDAGRGFSKRYLWNMQKIHIVLSDE